MYKKTVIIGSGFAGLSAACFMAKAGWQVTVVEKHPVPGGRARKLEAQGFSFDMGPSWYWMPDIFERFFNAFGKKVADYYTLQRLDPSYRIFGFTDITDIPADYTALKAVFEKTEAGSGAQLDKFLEEAAYKYKTGMLKLAYKPGRSVTEFLDKDLLAGIFRLDIFNSIKHHVHKYFRHDTIRQLMEFPVLFLGALPEKIPALYSLMNYADIAGGTWYPQGGMYRIVQAMHQLAVSLGVEFHFEHTVKQIRIVNNKATAIVTEHLQHQYIFETDAVIGGADYHHIETDLLPEASRSYSPVYWDTRIMAPGCLIYYIGLNKKLDNVQHHNLFFDASFEAHGRDIYINKQWPRDPLFYACVPSVTDASVAPAGYENLFLLIPAAAGLTGDTNTLRAAYLDNILTRMEQKTGQTIKQHIIYQETFAHSNFADEYNAFKGNAYGLANTLLQTAILKPSCRSKKLKNLFFTGQLTVPGPGVPPSLISGEVVAGEVLKAF